MSTWAPLKWSSRPPPRLSKVPSRPLMKIPPLAFLLIALLVIPAARAQANQLEINVRSEVKDKPVDKPLPEGAGQHGKIYAILAVQLIPEEEKVIKPVDAYKLKAIVSHELDTHGFRPAVKGQSPDILITVQYGRAWLRNPYFGNEQAHQTGVGGPLIRDLTPATTSSPRQTVAGFEQKAQKAQFEKLCIKLTAWENLSDPKARARQLWNTTMIVDDPDHRDLNTIAAEMLAAGAPYFDREIKEEEVDVYKPLPEGHVNVGTPEVVDGPKAK